MRSGVESFIADMANLGFDPRLESGLVVYEVVAVDGARANSNVHTAVGVSELGSWPSIPPHWIHFPSEIKFSQTNSQSSTKGGWLMHSRQINGWNDAPADIAWVSHVRAVLSEAIS